MSGYVGVDFDGTLAIGHAWPGLGDPVPAMVARIKHWRAQGIEVRIITARAAFYGPEYENTRMVQLASIREWCATHIGELLPVQAHKDYHLIELWDDRAVRVVLDTGQPCCDQHMR